MKYLAYILLVLASIFTAAAQPAQTLEYGQSVTGEITDRQFEVEYNFKADEGDVVLIQLIPEDTANGLSEPKITLLDQDSQVLTSTSASFDAVTLIFDVPADGTYVILATRQDGRTGATQGKYTLTLSEIKALNAGKEVEVSVSSENPVYFALRSEASFNVRYTRQRGNFYPEIALNIIEEQRFSDSNLLKIASISGERLQRGTLGVDLVGDKELFILSIAEPPFQFNFEEKTADISLKIELNQ